MEKIVAMIVEIVTDILGEGSVVTGDTQLVGGDAQLDSMQLVEVCLALEDKAEQLGFDFDWTSDATLSRSRSMFRSVTTLAEEFFRQQQG
jgi:acyl carrier protein